eukprot:ANDGO_06230.mRNA.1 ABC transporter G family member 24
MSQIVCPPGKSCGNLYCNATGVLPCFPGLVCPQNKAIIPCPDGEFCPDYQMTSGIGCRSGYWCPQYSKDELECNFGAYCPKGADRQVQWFGLVIAVVAIVVIAVAYLFGIRIRNQKRTTREHRRKMQTIHRTGNGSSLPLRPYKDEESTSLLSSQQVSGARRGVEFRFSNIRLEIGEKQPWWKRLLGSKASSKAGKVLLSDVSGVIRPGTLTGIMGPSGAGKTTLMSVLAGKIEHTSGKMFVNGTAIRTVAELKRIRGPFGFVPQDDVMHNELSVKEVLFYNALLRLPPSITNTQCERTVQSVLGQLELSESRHSIVGTAGKGIPSSQRKRVNIGMELVASIDTLWLDEPTTGLDSAAAESVCRHLKDVARSGVTVAAVLHQPRNEIFGMLDHVILLAPGGKVAYAGPPGGVEGYLESLGCVCPEEVNISDYMMDVISGKVGNVDLAEKWREREGPAYNDVDDTYQGSSVNRVDDVSSTVAISNGHPSFAFQFWVFLRRTSVLYYRLWDSFLVNVAMRVLAGLTVGIAFASGKVFVPPIPLFYAQLNLCPSILSKEFCQMPIRDNTPPLNDYCIMAVGLVAMASAVRTFGRDRLVTWRESSVGINWVAVSFAKWLVDVPMIAIYSLCFTASMLIVSSLEGPLPQYWLVFFCIEFCVFGFGYCLSACMRAKNAILVGVIAALSFVVTDGSAFSIHSLGPFAYISYPRWAAEAIFLTAIQYDSMTPEDQQLMRYVVDNYKGWNLDNYSLDILAMLLIGMVFRVIQLFLLWVCNRDKRR